MHHEIENHDKNRKKSEKKKLDKIDRKLIDLLYSDSQMKYQKLAQQINVSVGSVHNRIKALTQRGYIKKFTIQPNTELLGLDLTVVIQMHLEVTRLSEVNDQLQRIQEIIAIYNVTGDFDVISIGRFRNRHHLNQVLQRILQISGVKRTSTHLVLQVLKEEWYNEE